MSHTRLSIRLDLTREDRIGPGKIALLEAIDATGSISAGARQIGMSYRRAWLLVEQINLALAHPAVEAAPGGRQGGGATLTPVGTQLIATYHAIETLAYGAASEQFRIVEKLARKPGGLKAKPPEAQTEPNIKPNIKPKTKTVLKTGIRAKTPDS